VTFGPIQSPDMPVALGPYSHAVRAGDFVFVSGQAGLDPATGSVPSGGFEEEARQAFVNLRTVVAASGASMERVVRTTVFLTDAEAFPALNLLFAEFFPSNPPARATPIVSLPRGLRISIEATLFVG
jgi:2-iminobutanoate/2-iminopropanoate deaminase